MITLLIALSFTIVTLGSIAAWSRRKRVPRMLAVVFCLFTLLLTYLTIAETLGQPRPSRAEIVHGETSEVIAFWFVEGEAIYIWVIDRSGVPLSYKLEWSLSVAKALHEAMRTVGIRGGRVQGTPAPLNGEPTFWHDPPVARPPKS